LGRSKEEINNFGIRLLLLLTALIIETEYDLNKNNSVTEQ